MTTSAYPLTKAQAAVRDKALANVAAAEEAKQQRLDEVRKPYQDSIRAKQAARAEAERQERARQDAERAAKEQAAHDALAERLRTRFLAAGGTAERWEQEREQVVAAHLQQSVLAGDEAARIGNARRYG